MNDEKILICRSGASGAWASCHAKAKLGPHPDRPDEARLPNAPDREFDGEELEGFCHSIAFIWQVRPFYEGNTRTVAVFSELYLNHLGFDVANEPFAEHVIAFKRSMGNAGYSGVVNPLFFNDNTDMLLGDAKASVDAIIAAL